MGVARVVDDPLKEIPIMALVPLYCVDCGKTHTHYLPVEPLYSPEDVATLLFTSKAAVMQWLRKHKVEAVYRKDFNHRLHRVIPASVVRQMVAERTYVRPAKGERVRKLAESRCS
jgi:hypothetical protein